MSRLAAFGCHSVELETNKPNMHLVDLLRKPMPSLRFFQTSFETLLISALERWLPKSQSQAGLVAHSDLVYSLLVIP